MKKLMVLLLMFGFAGITACASNETVADAEDQMNEEASAQMAAAKDDADAKKAEMMEKAEAEKARMKEEAEAKKAQMMAEAEAKKAEMMAKDEDSLNKQSVCSFGEQQRIITVVYDNDETDTVCEVTYEKSTGTSTLWTANSDRDYCLEKAKAFVEKQEGWGWSCTSME